MLTLRRTRICAGWDLRMEKKHFINELFMVKIYFHFKTLSMLIKCAESLSYDV